MGCILVEVLEGRIVAGDRTAVAGDSTVVVVVVEDITVEDTLEEMVSNLNSLWEMITNKPIVWILNEWLSRLVVESSIVLTISNWDGSNLQ